MPVTVALYHPRDPQLLYAYAVRPNLGFVKSTDRGQTWTSMGFFPGKRDAGAMPLIPGLGVGLLPVLQMLVLPPVIFSLASKGIIHPLRSN